MCAARAARAEVPRAVNGNHSDREMVNVNRADRDKALELALAQIDKAFGRGAIMKLSDRGGQDIDVIPTGSIALDMALGVGGLPRGRVVEIFGA